MQKQCETAQAGIGLQERGGRGDRTSFRFERLMIKRSAGLLRNLRYFPQVMRLYIKYLRHLEDDFSRFSQRPLEGMVEFIERTTPHFYLVLKGDEVCGFFSLEHLIGSSTKIYSAEVVTCFDRKYWGTFTKYAARTFQDFCFNELGIVKLKALVYPQNSRVKAVLRTCGFTREAYMKAETRKNTRLQDIEIYSVFNEDALQNAKFKEDLCN